MKMLHILGEVGDIHLIQLLTHWGSGSTLKTYTAADRINMNLFSKINLISIISTPLVHNTFFCLQKI